MPSQRRVRQYISAVVVLLILGLWYTSSTRSSRQSAKYMETLIRLGEQDRIHQAVVEKLHSRLREAADTAKERVNAQMGDRFKAKQEQEKMDWKQEAVVEEKKDKVEEKVKEKGEQIVVGKEKEEEAAVPKKQPKEPKSDDSLESDAYDPSTELTDILHRAPIIIFSKSYCPHSAAAKHILLNSYILTPPPHIVELDLHPHGRELQDFLKEKTGRGTVPNILVNGKSLGGGDEVRELDGLGDLGNVLRRMGGKRLGVEEKNKKKVGK